ncbi:ATPase P-type K/Mg/Cd/Cu/Zn/Na/Ca/Na/H-transporter [Penicillium cf. griseofulvum]|uniref:Calcium-transporting ATPase n=1 Tax=Penicillium cf. griseofulvum TaxID=2972120 RepID=A0A9W9J2C7_9EURO|nr:ATPase P-type K/Mg/Cd/Cu/Zn/Na/Ca/Na/H-transporter [Penicillium cf. griseofulvum]KAJ5434414.1 ATPase P-type K/Mg/Cd/Cu/Zn/Na/Ca/Na/H-transporter [Penicillium cf. griseofulvum]KAJ5452245.1 ATPase P-type K/Mg/Cd/Cu/Zn/Na/Ca/Na/H-transporter [Penicillium cf. griseofulvum]
MAWNQPDPARLMVQNASHQPSQSIDGDTLRPRAGSFASSAETVVRSRANSEVNPTSKDAYDDVSLSDALKPDPRNESDFQVEDNRFAFSPGQLNKMQNPKSLAAFHALGGLQGLERGLRTDLNAGLSIDEGRLEGKVKFQDVAPQHTSTEKSSLPATANTSTPAPVSAGNGAPFEDRIRVFSQNKLPARKSVGFLTLLWTAYNDKIIILLTCAAVVSLSLGIYETVSEGSGVDWVEGVAICVAILIVTIVTAANDWQKERQFAKLNKRNDDRDVKVTRSGKTNMVSIYDIMVGDILHLEAGDSIPADGILVSGYGVKCDESSATGESDQMNKTPGHEVWQQIVDGKATKKLDPFLISGSKVLEGVGTYIVTSVGPYSTYGRILLSLQTPNDPTPLQVKLGKLADWIGALGTAAALILFFVLLFRFVADLPNHPEKNSTAKGKEFVDILIVAVTVIVVAIPEGLPLAVTLALAFATTRMVKENNLVRVLRACETMGNATVICSDKTGTLTQNKMTVVAGTWGSDRAFSQRTEDEDVKGSMTTSAVSQQLSAPIKDLIIKSIALNSTAFEQEKDGAIDFVGSKTEVAMLQLARDYMGMDLASERGSAEIVQLIPFNSARKCMGVVYRVSGAGYRLLVKGASELMVGVCTSGIINIDTSKEMPDTEQLSETQKQHLLDLIDSYAQNSLRTIGMVYKDLAAWPPAEGKHSEDSSPNFDDFFHGMTWVGVVGIQDPLRPEVPEAIRKCHSAGVQVKMVTGDNVATATAIASSCGIKTEGGLVMEGPKFRQLTNAEMDEVVPRLQVLARSSPDDKRILVERLKALGETVAVTGDGTNDGPALRTADVGFSMGIAGTEVAKEASSIILLDDNFKSIITAISWGRAVNDAVAKFLQFQVTVNITAVILTFVSSVYSSDNTSVLTAVQLLWVNLIMDTFAALALATDAPTEKILDRKPVPKHASLFTMTMWKMILGQAVYQLAVTFMLYFGGEKLLGAHLNADPKMRTKELSTVVFNTFVWMQIFNEFNNRRLDNKFNIFEGMFRNYWFLGINAIMVGGQIMIVYVGGQAFAVTRLSGTLWGVCVICSIACLPWAIVLRLIPDRHFGIVFNAVVGAMAVVLRPLSKGCKALGRGIRSIFRPVKRFTRRVFNKKSKNEVELNSQPANSDSEAAPERLEQSKQESPERPTTPPLVVPPITITTSP